MSYFNNFNFLNYTFPDGIKRYYKDISIRLDLTDEAKNDLSNFQPYYVKENETPELVSYNFYNDVNYHWCIMLINNIFSLYNDWPKDTAQLDMFLIEKYKTQTSKYDSEVVLSNLDTTELLYFTGTPSNSYQDSDGKYSVIFRPHHFEDADKNIYSYDTALGEAKDAFGRYYTKPTLVPVSYYTYEYEKNEAKRNILIPNLNLILQMEKELVALTRG